MTFCWGSTTHGQLGLGGLEDDQIKIARKMDVPISDDVVKIACGTMHTLLLTKSGQLYSCGNNDHGQLGHDRSRKRPQLIPTLENYVIVRIACGASHSLAVNEWGQLFAWGSNASGQLGHDTHDSVFSTPKIVKALATKNVIQIASGKYHNLALTYNGELYVWGSNSYGQLGLGFVGPEVLKPTIVKQLSNVPIAYIACGGNHSFIITTCGDVFGWGQNTSGQLGINHTNTQMSPFNLKSLHGLGVRYITGGDNFSIFLTMDGRVFSCGNGMYGQLGHSGKGDEILPRVILELMGTECSQIACGRLHTLTLVPSLGRIYGFGLGAAGQLGTHSSLNSNTPQLVIGPWLTPQNGFPNGKTNEIDGGLDNGKLLVREIFCGGDQSFALIVNGTLTLEPIDFRIYDSSMKIGCLTMELALQCANISGDDSVDLELMSHVETLFKSVPCLNASFLHTNTINCHQFNSGLDIHLAQQTFDVLRKIENDSIKNIIWDCLTTDLLPSFSYSAASIEALRSFILIPMYHEFVNSKHYKLLHTPFSRAFRSLPDAEQQIVSNWWAMVPSDYFERLIECYKSVIVHILQFDAQRNRDNKVERCNDHNMICTLMFLKNLYHINRKLRVHKVPYRIFAVPELVDLFYIPFDYVEWYQNKKSQHLYMCDYPFLFDAPAKNILLETDQALQMKNAMDSAISQTIFMYLSGGPAAISQFVVLNVSRDNIVEDTLREILHYGANDLKKPLKIKFHNEEAEDAGGVRKEFFMLLLKDLLDPKYGMFKEYEDSRAMWFSENSFEAEETYILIGVLCGLAIYNFTIINIPFPLALYKKLLKHPVDLGDLKDLSPTLHNSLQSILDYSEWDFEEVFDLNFELTREYFGEIRNVPLKENGSEIIVTQANKREYVDLYVDFILNKSVEKQFQGFYSGFMKVCGGRVLELFEPHELMAVIVGNEDYDWHILQENAEYKNGYRAGDETIIWFWEVFHELPLSEKKNFLLYLTGSDRIPIQGMKAIKIYIQPTNDDKFLPVAHTCFNLLDLPRYKTKERLKYKLLQAITQTHGFSIV